RSRGWNSLRRCRRPAGSRASAGRRRPGGTPAPAPAGTGTAIPTRPGRRAGPSPCPRRRPRSAGYSTTLPCSPRAAPVLRVPLGRGCAPPPPPPSHLRCDLRDACGARQGLLLGGRRDSCILLPETATVIGRTHVLPFLVGPLLDGPRARRRCVRARVSIASRPARCR